MRRLGPATNTKSLYKSTNAFLIFICFKLVMKLMNFINSIIYFHFSKNIFSMLKQIDSKRTLVNLYKNIVWVTRVRICCTTLFTNNNIKVVIQMHAFLFDP